MPTPEPTLESIFREYPVTRASFVPRRFADELNGWSWDPWRLHECSEWHTFYDRTWQDPDRAFALWVSDRRRSGPWRGLHSEGDRILFRAAFEDGFIDGLAGARGQYLDEFYGFGFDDGFTYGAYVSSEWSFRRGYVRGFDEAMQLAASITFERAYRDTFDRAYDEAFDEWSTSAHPAILEASLRDGNDDGVFQPGEDLAVDWTVANYGGAAGRFAAHLEGTSLAQAAAKDLTLQPRRLVQASSGLTARLASPFEVPSQQTLVLRLDTERKNLPVRISYPLEFSGEIGYHSAPADGRASVAFVIENRSRRTVDDVVVILDRTGEQRAIGRVAGGRTAEVSFDLEGIPPLDLLAGRLDVRADAVASDTVHSRANATFPALATDLGSPALVDYLISLGHSRNARPEDAAGARSLLAQRLAADWAMAAAGSGNPYKDDVQDGGKRTALGELVAAYSRDRKVLSRSTAFRGLSDELDSQIERLPGVHPMLRKWMKKLASQVS